MNTDQRFEDFIELCKRIFERMEREGSWPWPEDDIAPKPPTEAETRNADKKAKITKP